MGDTGKTDFKKWVPTIGQDVFDSATKSIGEAGTTPEELGKILWPAWSDMNPAKATTRAATVLSELQQLGRVLPVNDRWQLVNETEAESNGAAHETLFDPDEGTDTEQPSQTPDPVTEKPMAKRGRKPGSKNTPKPEANGAPAEPVKAAAPKAEPKEPAKKASLFTAQDSNDHLAAIDRCETELADAKISYEDALNVRRLAKAKYDVAKSERRRFSVHDYGSDLKQITAAQKIVDKAEKSYNEAQADCLEKKNAVNNCEAKLSRTIGGEMPLFDTNEGGEE